MIASNAHAEAQGFVGGLRQVLFCLLVGIAEVFVLLLALLFATGLLAW
jgi:hypothetical protein